MERDPVIYHPNSDVGDEPMAVVPEPVGGDNRRHSYESSRLLRSQ
jgi:hypothetical protein